jgi:ADP-ribose pyrophosphatase YjhB (NUDIX family)
VPGACKDVLADLIGKFGRPPIIQRVLPVESGKIKDDWRLAAWVAGGLVFDEQGRVALVKHQPDSGWDDVWVPPGGLLEAGEPADEGFRREVREETGLEVEDLHVTRIFNNAYLEPSGRRYPFYFVQFVARAASKGFRPDDREVREARWFDDLPEDMAFRDDYVEDFRGWREAFRADPGPAGRAR